MIAYLKKKHTSLPYRILSGFIAFTFTFSLVLPPTYAQLLPQTVLNLPVPGTMVPPSIGFVPALMTGVTIHPDNPLRFDFIMDRGQSGLAGDPLKEEYTKMIKYFMASLTVPEDELWVNLSPHEKDRMIAEGLGKTGMGRDMLAQDYLLKQLTASLMYPEKELGKTFWDRVYKKAQEQFGTMEIPVNTFNKVWIVPDEALVYEQGTSAFVIKSRLAVMLEQDYLAANQGTLNPEPRTLSPETEIIREIIIPEIEKEVNEGKNFANLRQIYNALILATWYKQKLTEGAENFQPLLGKVYVNQNKTKGIDTQDKEINQKIYDQYIESFQKGVYNFIKEDVDPATQEVIPRKYFSGGARLTYHPRKGSLILKTVGSLLVGALLAFGSPAPANARDLVTAATQGNKDGVTTEFVDNAKQGDIGTAITVREGEAVQPVLLAQATKDKEKLKGPASSPVTAEDTIFRTRRSGILMHITSLPSAYGNGDLGPQAYQFVDFLVESGQTIWQHLPIGPTNPGDNSPYNSPSPNAGNKLLISPELLLQDEFLQREDLEFLPEFLEGKILDQEAREYKDKILGKAYQHFKEETGWHDEFDVFVRDNAYWLEEYALMETLKRENNGQPWFRWGEDYRFHKEGGLKEFLARNQDAVNQVRFEQFIFNKQWHALKAYANTKGIKLFGDMPIYVPRESEAVWANRHLFKLDAQLEPIGVSGVPPDYFSPTGQLWNHPVYRWEAHQREGFQWWKNRLRRQLDLYDYIRVDHFRGLVQYWEVPAGAKTAMAEDGATWQDVPTNALFDALQEEFGKLPIVAEDLGEITPDVIAARDKYSLPGLRILHFAFGDKSDEWRKNPFLPHNYAVNTVTYTGTHDNNTTSGWWKEDTDELVRQRLEEYLREQGYVSDEDGIDWTLIKMAMDSVAAATIFPVQDVLGLGSDHRMNRPGEAEGHWRWQMTTEQFEELVNEGVKLRELTESIARAPASSPVADEKDGKKDKKITLKSSVMDLYERRYGDFIKSALPAAFALHLVFGAVIFIPDKDLRVPPEDDALNVEIVSLADFEDTLKEHGVSDGVMADQVSIAEHHPQLESSGQDNLVLPAGKNDADKPLMPADLLRFFYQKGDTTEDSARRIKENLSLLEQVLQQHPLSEEQSHQTGVAADILFDLVNRNAEQSSQALGILQRSVPALKDLTRKKVSVADPGKIPYSHLEGLARKGHGFAIQTLVDMYQAEPKYTAGWYGSSLALNYLLSRHESGWWGPSIFDRTQEKDKTVFDIISPVLGLSNEDLSRLKTSMQTHDTEGAFQFVNRHPSFGYLILYHQSGNSQLLTKVRQDASLPLELRIYALILGTDSNDTETFARIIREEKWDIHFRELLSSVEKRKLRSVQEIVREDFLVGVDRFKAYLAAALFLNRERSTSSFLRNPPLDKYLQLADSLNFTNYTEGTENAMGLFTLASTELLKLNPNLTISILLHEQMHVVLSKGGLSYYSAPSVSAVHEMFADIAAHIFLQNIPGDQTGPLMAAFHQRYRYADNWAKWKSAPKQDNIYVAARGFLEQMRRDFPDLDWMILSQAADNILPQHMDSFLRNTETLAPFIEYVKEIRKNYESMSRKAPASSPVFAVMKFLPDEIGRGVLAGNRFAWEFNSELNRITGGDKTDKSAIAKAMGDLIRTLMSIEGRYNYASQTLSLGKPFQVDNLIKLHRARILDLLSISVTTGMALRNIEVAKEVVESVKLQAVEKGMLDLPRSRRGGYEGKGDVFLKIDNLVDLVKEIDSKALFVQKDFRVRVKEIDYWGEDWVSRAPNLNYIYALRFDIAQPSLEHFNYNDNEPGLDIVKRSPWESAVILSGEQVTGKDIKNFVKKYFKPGEKFNTQQIRESLKLTPDKDNKIDNVLKRLSFVEETNTGWRRIDDTRKDEDDDELLLALIIGSVALSDSGTPSREVSITGSSEEGERHHEAPTADHDTHSAGEESGTYHSDPYDWGDDDDDWASSPVVNNEKADLIKQLKAITTTMGPRRKNITDGLVRISKISESDKSEVVLSLIEIVKNKEFRRLVRVTAINVLGEIGDSRAEDVLIDLLNEKFMKSSYEKLHGPAAYALRKIGTTKALGALIAVLGTRGVRDVAAEALLSQQPVDEKTTGLLIEALNNKAGGSAGRSRAADILGIIGDFRAIEALIERLFHEEDVRVRDHAGVALINLAYKVFGFNGQKEEDLKYVLAVIDVVKADAVKPDKINEVKENLSNKFKTAVDSIPAPHAGPPASSPVKDRVQGRGGRVQLTNDERRTTKDEVGGIDLNPALLDLQIRRDGNGVPLPLPMQPIESMHIEGFLPVIINIVPITNLPLLLGLDLPPQDEDPVQLTYHELSLVVTPARERFHARKLDEVFI